MTKILDFDPKKRKPKRQMAVVEKKEKDLAGQLAKGYAAHELAKKAMQSKESDQAAKDAEHQAQSLVARLEQMRQASGKEAEQDHAQDFDLGI